MHSYKSILVADDDPNDVFFLKTCLEHLGCQLKVIAASDGQKIIDLLARSTRADLAPACLFLDLKMPRYDGFEVLEWLSHSAEWRYLPVLVLSSSNDAGDQERAFSLGACEFLVKPTRITELTKLLGQVSHRIFPKTTPAPGGSSPKRSVRR